MNIVGRCDAGGGIRDDGLFMQRHPAAYRSRGAEPILAADPVVDPIAVADVPATRRAELPDRMLHKAREVGREGRVHSSRVEGGRCPCDEFGAASQLITRWPVRVLTATLPYRTRAMEVVVNESVDRDHTGPSRDPALAGGIADEKQVGQRHRQYLIGDAEDVA